MSSISTAYGVDLEKIAAALGGKDQQLFHSIERSIRPDPLAAPGNPTVHEGMKALIEGSLLDSRVGRAMQLYALELLCSHFGKPLDGHGHVSYLKNLEIETRLLEYKIPFDIPAADDFPMVSHLTGEQVHEEYAHLAEIEFEDADPEIEDGREELIGWLQQCDRGKLAMVVFQY